MAMKSMGLWLGAAVLASTACAHNAESARNTNTANEPVATQDNSGSTNPNGTWTPPGATPNGTSSDPYSGTTGAPDTGSSSGTMNPSGMAGTTGETGSTGSWNTQHGTQDKGAVLSKADGSQPGVIQEFSEGTLTLTSRGQGTRQTPRVQTMMIPPSVPIFSGDARVSTDALVPGADVRVYFKTGMGDEQREVVGVDILKPTSPHDSTGAPSPTNE